MIDKEFHNMYTITVRINDLLYECHYIDDFSKLNNIIKKCNPDKLSTGRLISLMSTIKWGLNDIDYYSTFFSKCEISLRKRGDWVDDLLIGLEP